MKRFRIIYQKDAMQCGVACLAMIARHYGLKASLGALESVCTPTREGVSLKGIGDAADALGFTSQAALIDVEGFRNIPLP